MAKKFVRGITDVKTINNQDFDTNNVNDLLSDGEHSYIHRKKKDGSEEYHNLTDNVKTVTSENTDLLTVTKDNDNNSVTLTPKHDDTKQDKLTPLKYLNISDGYISVTNLPALYSYSLNNNNNNNTSLTFLVFNNFVVIYINVPKNIQSIELTNESDSVLLEKLSPIMNSNSISNRNIFSITNENGTISYNKSDKKITISIKTGETTTNDKTTQEIVQLSFMIQHGNLISLFPDMYNRID